MTQPATFNVHQHTQCVCAQMFTDQLTLVDSLSIKPNARFAWNIKWLIMEGEVNESYQMSLRESEATQTWKISVIVMFWCVKCKQIQFILIMYTRLFYGWAQGRP